MAPAFASNVEFNKLVSGRQDIDLVELMLEFAADAYPALDRAAHLSELDRLGERARRRIAASGASCGPLVERLQTMSELLYGEERFQGNEEAYYDPRNSYLNEVLASRKGIPISLAIVYMAVAARAGVHTFGVAAPGHFVVGARESRESWFVDPFHQGLVLDRDACRRRIEEVLGEPGVLGDEHFRPASALEIGARVLRNLKAAYVMENRWAPVLPVQQRLVLLLPEAPDEQRDLGLMYLRNGRPVKALELLNDYLARCSDEQAEAVEPYLRAARRLAAELN
ncbi:MAG TPA: transglutaminase-like domain-containing protein [Pirellulales bacterium]|nr:transglutaminase-like domain-containing protein [Pirellulales bacterium]